MAKNTARSILERQLVARRKLWPELTDRMLWSMDNDGWVALPRLMPLMLSIMDDLSGKGFPVSRTYLELWSRTRVEESFLALNRPEEMAFHAGFEGQRALRTWKDRMQRLANLGFIGLKPGPLGDLSYAVIYNPYHVIKRAYIAGLVHENKWQALVIRANEVSAFDIDDINDHGELIAPAPPQGVAPAPPQGVAPASPQAVAPASPQAVAPASQQAATPAPQQTVTPAPQKEAHRPIRRFRRPHPLG